MSVDIFVILLIFLCSVLCSQVMANQILWSIVWCNIGGKYKKLIAIKKENRKKSFFSMKIAESYLKKHSKDFRFWKHVKYVLLFADTAVFIGCLLFAILLPENAKSFPTLVQVIYFLAEMFVLRLQFRQGRDTVYDLERRYRKSKKDHP